jgi:hypothetical protein
MNLEIGAEAPIFLFWEYLFQIFRVLSLQCGVQLLSFFNLCFDENLFNEILNYIYGRLIHEVN